MVQPIAFALVVSAAILNRPFGEAFIPVLKSLPRSSQTDVSFFALDMSSAVPDADDVLIVPQEKRLSKMSQAMPFLARPPVLKGQLAGDVGFDPLNLAKNEEALYDYREAEIKHARLAMLAAAGWPLSELLDKKIAALFDISPILDSTDRVPSLLNGGLEKIVPEFWGFCLGLCAAIDLYGVQRARSANCSPDYVPGDFNFDPLGLYPADEEGRKRMQLAEIKHGRLAMIAITGFAVQEAISKVGVVDETPFFFHPITQILRGLVQ